MGERAIASFKVIGSTSDDIIGNWESQTSAESVRVECNTEEPGKDCTTHHERGTELVTIIPDCVAVVGKYICDGSKPGCLRRLEAARDLTEQNLSLEYAGDTETAVSVNGLLQREDRSTVQATQKDPNKAHTTSGGMLSPAAKQAYRNARGLCPSAQSNVIGGCGIVLATSSTNKRNRTGTNAVSNCAKDGVDKEVCQQACDAAVSF